MKKKERFDDTPEKLDVLIERSARIGMAAIRKGDYKTAGEARFWVMLFQEEKKIMLEEKK